MQLLIYHDSLRLFILVFWLKHLASNCVIVFISNEIQIAAFRLHWAFENSGAIRDFASEIMKFLRSICFLNWSLQILIEYWSYVRVINLSQDLLLLFFEFVQEIRYRWKFLKSHSLIVERICIHIYINWYPLVWLLLYPLLSF